jgi:hypothetical protein
VTSREATDDEVNRYRPMTEQLDIALHSSDQPDVAVE